MKIAPVPIDAENEDSWEKFVARAKVRDSKVLYDPNQPRDPAGSPTGGQWTDGGSMGGPLDKDAMLAKLAELHGNDPPPPDASEDLMKQLVEDPEQRALIEAAKEQADAMPRTNEIDTPERLALREQVAREAYGDGAPVKEREAWIVTGPPASGKNKAVSDQLAEKRGALIIDNDLIKQRLPEYGTGIGAGAVHLEAADIIQPAVLSRAVMNGDNIVMPRVGQSYESLAADIETMKAAGYRVHLAYVHVPDRVAVDRAIKRFKSSGRLVSVSYVRSVDGHPRKAFERAIKNGIAHRYSLYNNNVPAGTPAEKVF